MYFLLGLLKRIFILNKIKIDAADTSRPKSKITVSKKSFFFKSNSFWNHSWKMPGEASLNLRGWLITVIFDADHKGVFFPNEELEIDH